jgi:hypothetical protein
MNSYLLPSLIINIKLIFFKYITILKYNLKLSFKNFFFFINKKNFFFILKNNFKNIPLKLFLNKLFNFLNGFIKKIKISGKRFKFYINSFFFFFKMDTSKFSKTKLTTNIFLQKKKKYIKFFFFSNKILELLKKIKNLKIPNKYTKKGIIFLN